MSTITRRHSLSMGLAALILGACPVRSTARMADGGPSVEGCCLLHQEAGKDAGVVPPEERTLESSGDHAVDRALGRALVHLSDEFGVYPGFMFYDDYDAPNAIAAPFSLRHDTAGTVLFGIDLFHTQIDAHRDGDIAVLGICAHEFGHIVQYFSPYYRELRRAHRTVKLVELHADFLAGHFVARRRERFPDLKLQGLGAAWEAMGDVLYTDPKHHGTPAERLAAIEQGYFWGRDQAGAIREAAEAGARFVKESFS